MRNEQIKLLDAEYHSADLNEDAESESFGTFEIQQSNMEDHNPLFRQTLAAIGPMIIAISSGMVSGYSAILLPQLDEDEIDGIKVTKAQESWIASMAVLPMALGCIFGGWAMEQFGRKRTQLYGCFFFMAGWTFIFIAKDMDNLLIGRLITGFCVGFQGPPITIFLAENSHPRYRGFFLAAISLSIALGLMITHALGTFLHWRLTALLTMIAPIVSVLVLLPIPESFIWYINKGDYKSATESFCWLRGKSDEAKKELSMNIKNHEAMTKLTTQQLMQECLTAKFLKPLFILNLFFATAQFSGNNAVVFYSVNIMQNTVPTLNKYAAMLIVDSIRVVMSVAACVLNKHYKVRTLTMLSGAGTALSLYFLAVFILLASIYPENDIYPLIPLVALILYITFISIGLVPLPWSLCGELYPPATKGIGGGISTAINFLAFFVVVKTSPNMFEDWGPEITFITYGSFALIGTILLYFVLPETKGKTLVEIEAYFSTTRNRVHILT